jgi:hypothetical protein
MIECFRGYAQGGCSRILPLGRCKTSIAVSIT